MCIRLSRVRYHLLGALAVPLLVMLGCTSGETPTAAPAVPTSTQMPAASQPTQAPAAMQATPAPAPTQQAGPAVATATPVLAQALSPTPTTSTAASAPTGSLVVAVSDVGPASGYRPFDMAWPYNNRLLLLGIYESALRYEPDFQLAPSLASSWELRPEEVILKVRPGVMFHDTSVGELTAHDFVFTFEDGRQEGNKKLGEVINPFYGEITALDDETVRMEVKSPNMRWISVLTKLLDGNAPIASKKLFDKLGPEQFNVTSNGTGPFKLAEAVSDDRFVLEAVPSHWRQTAGYARVSVVEVPEQATQTAMLKTGEADIIPVAVNVLEEVKAVPGVYLVEGAQNFGSGGVNVFLAGQYYAQFKKDGTPTNQRPATERPWVGDPNDPQDMANARKVRMAMSMAIDREAVLDTILGGAGCLGYVIGMDSCNVRWQSKWTVPTDPAQAKQLLAEAGYPQGFEFPLFIPVGVNPVLEEVGEALLPMWDAIGLKANVEKAAYSTKRPLMLARELSDAWVWNHSDYGTPINVISGIGFQTADTVWTPGYQYQWSQEYVDRLGQELDLDKQWEIVLEWMQRMYDEMPTVQVASFVTLWGVSPSVTGWVYNYHTASWPDELSSARPAR